MRVTGGRLRLGLFAVVLALLCVNALAVWGQQAAQVVFMALQATIGLAAIVCAFVVARRKHGLERSWRLAVIAAFVASLVGDLLFAAGCRLAQGHLFGRAVAISDVQFHRPTVSVPQRSGD